MSQHPRDTQPLAWLTAQNMLLTMCLKATLSKLDPEVSREVARAMNSTLDTPEHPMKNLLKVAAADLLTRVLPNERIAEIEQAMNLRSTAE